MNHERQRFSPLLVSLLTLSACVEQDDTVPEPVVLETESVTYYEDVLPIFAESCNTCHTDGAIGPFVLDDYNSAAAWAPLIATVVQDRTMPPYAANNDGSCNSFKDTLWLSDEDIELITQWVEDGAEAGDPTTLRPPVREPNVLHAEDIMEVHTPDGYVPVPETYVGGELEDYQCFLALPEMDRDRFLTGFDVIPGNPETVHHVLAFEVDPGLLGNAETMAELDAASPNQPGWDCSAAAGEGVFPGGVPVAWGPGTGAVNYPEGTGIRIEASHALVVQMHYNLLTDTGPDSTIVRLGLADSVDKEAFNTIEDPFLFSSLIGSPEQLEPGRERVTYEWSMPLAEAGFEGGHHGDVDIWGVLPHMHGRGTSMTIEFGQDGDMQCGAQIDNWDFNWQRFYFFEQPFETNYAETLRVTCEYDTRRDTEPVLPGFGTQDEMCLIGLYLVPK